MAELRTFSEIALPARTCLVSVRMEHPDIMAPKLLILASAGSGKTYQLSNRIIGLIARGAQPERIVALTFTRKAAGEFADATLNKLARAAADPDFAARLRGEIGLELVDFRDLLSRLARNLHRITLGTMDSFFARVVRGFQYELGLTGGRFELLEGPQLRSATDEILARMLGDVLGSEDGEAFIQALRRASLGKEQQGISGHLREFVRKWHGRHLDHPGLVWGPDQLAAARPEDWEAHKHGFFDGLHNAIQAAGLKDSHSTALCECLDSLRRHTIGSGVIGRETKTLVKQLLEAARMGESGPMELKHRTTFTLDQELAFSLRSLLRLAAQCELAAAVERTRAIGEVISLYDRHCQRQLRSQGRLGFSDVKRLMGQWAADEPSRLRREAVDFRLDARSDHWLLDEFQDTSRADWLGLQPLINEVASDEGDRSLFIVGDRKQGIYAWRGGDVAIFDEVLSRYGHGMKTDQLNESWRSSPEVLSLVNRVCADQTTGIRLFGAAGKRWDCPTHISAEPLRGKQRRGHARVEFVDGWDAKHERIAELIEQLGVGKRKLTCGILLRRNDRASEVADMLRSRGVDVVLEGQRRPGSDTPIGVAVTQLYRWLADPADSFARGTLLMSPLAAALTALHGEGAPRQWENLGAAIARDGHATAVEALLNACRIAWSAFGANRIRDLLGALAELDRGAPASARDVAALLAELEISQAPGTAAVQVMTIHKAKGLGFDIVVLPEIPDDAAAEPQRFDVATTKRWINQMPPLWARRILPELESCETIWAEQQNYEAMCMLYVALTRAKRGLHVLLDPPSANPDPDKPSLANWMLQSCGWAGGEGPEPIFAQGDADWVQEMDFIEERAGERSIPALPPAAKPAATARHAPSQAGHTQAPNTAGMLHGIEVHALLEKVAWIDAGMPLLPASPAGAAVARLLASDAGRSVFLRNAGNIELRREQPVDAVLDGRWISGVIDRLHLHRDSSGAVTRIEIVDFKTDAVEDPLELKAAYQEQIDCYRQSIQRLHPSAEVRCMLLSTRHAAVVEL